MIIEKNKNLIINYEVVCFVGMYGYKTKELNVYEKEKCFSFSSYAKYFTGE